MYQVWHVCTNLTYMYIYSHQYSIMLCLYVLVIGDKIFTSHRLAIFNAKYIHLTWRYYVVSEHVNTSDWKPSLVMVHILENIFHCKIKVASQTIQWFTATTIFKERNGCCFNYKMQCLLHIYTHCCLYIYLYILNFIPKWLSGLVVTM